MPGPTTEHLADQLETTSRRLADEVHGLSERIARLEGRFDDFRVEISAGMARLEQSISVAKWTVGLLLPLVLAGVATVVWLAWHAGRLDLRVERLESRPTASARP